MFTPALANTRRQAALANTRSQAAIVVLTLNAFCFIQLPNGVRLAIDHAGLSSTENSFSTTTLPSAFLQNNVSQEGHLANQTWYLGHGVQQKNRSEAGHGVQKNRSEAVDPSLLTRLSTTLSTTLSTLSATLKQKAAYVKQYVSGVLGRSTVESQWLLLAVMKTEYFQRALGHFLENSDFFEKILMEDRLLTEALCGMSASSYIKFGLKNRRLKLRTQKLRIRNLTASKTALQGLAKPKAGTKASWAASFLNTFIDVSTVLAQPGMAELIIHELSKGDGIRAGLTPERMKEAFRKVKIRAAPEILGHRLKTASLQVRNMMLKSNADPTVVDTTDWDTWLQDHSSQTLGPEWRDRLQIAVSAISDILNTTFNTFGDPAYAAYAVVHDFLFSITDALVSKEIILARNFPKLLNAVLAPVKMDVWVVGWFDLPYLSAGTHLQFNPLEPRKKTGWGLLMRTSCP